MSKYFEAWWLADFLWSISIRKTRLVDLICIFMKFMTMKLPKMCPKYAYFCRKWSKSWSERPWGDFWLCPSKNMVNLGAFHCSKPIPPGAYTLSNWHVKKSIFVQFALFAACFHSAVADENGDNSGVLCPIMIKFCVVIDRDQDYAHTKF